MNEIPLWGCRLRCVGIRKLTGSADDGCPSIEIRVQPLQAVLTAPAARLESSIRCRPADVTVCVDPDHAGFDAGGHPQSTAGILSPEAGGEPVRRVVRQRNRLFFVVEWNEGSYGPENLLARNPHP